MGLVSLRVLRPVVFVPHEAKEHHGTFATGPTTPPFSISIHHTVTLHPYPWNISQRPITPPFSISNHHNVTLHPYPQAFVPVSRGCTPHSPHIHTHKDDDEGTSTHPSPPTPVLPSSFLYPPLLLAVKDTQGMPFSFCRFFICVMCVSFVAYTKYEEYLYHLQVC